MTRRRLTNAEEERLRAMEKLTHERAGRNPLRHLALWLAWNVPMGPLAPSLLGFGMKARRRRVLSGQVAAHRAHALGLVFVTDQALRHALEALEAVEEVCHDSFRDAGGPGSHYTVATCPLCSGDNGLCEQGCPRSLMIRAIAELRRLG